MFGRKVTVVLVLLAIGATACGSSSKSSTGTTPTTVAGSPTTAGSGSQSTGTPTTQKISGDSGSSFCDLVRNDENVFQGNNFTGSTPADLKKLYDNIGPVLDQAASKAPSAIKADFGTLVDGIKKLKDALAAADYDVTKLTPSSISGLDTPAFKAASDHIDQYMTQVCHITSTT